MITVLIRSLTTDPNVKDASMTQALCRYFDVYIPGHSLGFWIVKNFEKFLKLKSKSKFVVSPD
jgi:hypothetical protein